MSVKVGLGNAVNAHVGFGLHLAHRNVLNVLLTRILAWPEAR